MKFAYKAICCYAFIFITLGTSVKKEKGKYFNISIREKHLNKGENTEPRSLQHQELLSVSFIIEHVGNKTFLGIFLLYFQNPPLFLFLSSIISALIYSYYTIFVQLKVIDYIPFEIFQIVGTLMFLFMGLAILRNLMFTNDALEINSSKPSVNGNNLLGNNDDCVELFPIDMFNFEKILSLAKLLFVMLIIKAIENHQTAYSGNNIISENIELYCYEILSIAIGTLVAMFIAKIFTWYFCVECNLLISSIALLMIGFDTAIRLFSNISEIGIGSLEARRGPSINLHVE